MTCLPRRYPGGDGGGGGAAKTRTEGNFLHFKMVVYDCSNFNFEKEHPPSL